MSQHYYYSSQSDRKKSLSMDVDCCHMHACLFYFLLLFMGIHCCSTIHIFNFIHNCLDHIQAHTHAHADVHTYTHTQTGSHSNTLYTSSQIKSLVLTLWFTYKMYTEQVFTLWCSHTQNIHSLQLSKVFYLKF